MRSSSSSRSVPTSLFVHVCVRTCMSVRTSVNSTLIENQGKEMKRRYKVTGD